MNPTRLTSIALALALALALAACGASPTPAMFGAREMRVVRGGRAYAVFRRGDEVEVIRLGHAGRGEHGGIRATMIALVPEVTGCVPVKRSWRGDSGEMRGRVLCPRG